jgi:hypothetical protein
VPSRITNPTTPLGPDDEVFTVQATTTMTGVTKATLDTSLVVRSLTETLNAALFINSGFQVKITSVQDVTASAAVSSNALKSESQSQSQSDFEHRRLVSGVSVSWTASVSQTVVTSSNAIASAVSLPSFSTSLVTSLNANGLPVGSATTTGVIVSSPVASPVAAPTATNEKNKPNNTTAIIIGVVVPVVAVLLIAGALIYYYKFRKSTDNPSSSYSLDMSEGSAIGSVKKKSENESRKMNRRKIAVVS